jgi:hypothetical protein
MIRYGKVQELVDDDVLSVERDSSYGTASPNGYSRSRDIRSIIQTDSTIDPPCTASCCAAEIACGGDGRALGHQLGGALT